MKDNFLIEIALIILVIFISFVSCGNTPKEKNNAVQVEEIKNIEYSGIEEYEVQAFDTLSSISTKYIPTDEYMSDWIADVKRLNGRKTNDIYFGEVIKVYYY